MKTYFLRFGSGDPRTYTGLSPTFLIFVRGTDGATISPPGISESLSSSGLYQFQYGTTQPIAFLIDAATLSPGTSGRYVSGSIDPADRTDEYAATMIAIGNTAVQDVVQLGTTTVAIGNTSIAYGGSMYQYLQNTGSTLVAIGNTSIAYGGSMYQYLQNTGTTLVAIGNTSIIGITNTGMTLVAIGNTSIALGNTIVALQGPSIIDSLIGSVGSTFGGQNTDPLDLFGYMKRVLENLEGDNTFIKNSGSLSIYNRGSSTLLRNKTVTNGITTVTKTGL